MGLNQFSALTQEEFIQTYLTPNINKNNHKNAESDNLNVKVQLDDINWVSKGYVTRVKNQGICNAGWAFSATSSLECLSKARDFELNMYSESQLIDCSSSYGNHGCNAGLMTNAFKFVKENGIARSEEYPYNAEQGPCLKHGGPFTINRFVEVNDCASLGVSIQSQVVAVNVDASNWRSYREGVFYNCQSNLNHGVSLVGVNDGNWVIKNSWGYSWGEDGYIRLKGGNTCGICSMASYVE